MRRKMMGRQGWKTELTGRVPSIELVKRDAELSINSRARVTVLNSVVLCAAHNNSGLRWSHGSRLGLRWRN